MSDVSTVLSLSGHVPVTLQIARGGFFALLIAAAIQDVRLRRIPNAISFSLAGAGLMGAVVGYSWSTGVVAALIALAAGFAIWVPGYVLGWVGAGDVKLFAAAAAWMTPSQACWAAFAGALIGAVVGVATYVWSHGTTLAGLRFGMAIRNPVTLAEPLPSARGRDARVPYGVSLVAGLILQVSVPAWHAWLV